MASLFRLRINIYGVYTARLGYFRFHGRHLDFWQKFFFNARGQHKHINYALHLLLVNVFYTVNSNYASLTEKLPRFIESTIMGQK